MEGQLENVTPANVESTTVETPIAENVKIPIALDNQEELEQGGKFELVSFLLVVGFLSASLYSIYYHRQALNKLNDSSSDDTIKREVREVKTNLKKLMGNKYEYTA